MKRRWTTEELIEQWTLTSDDFLALGNKTGPTRLGFAVLLTYFHCERRFPRGRQDIPQAVVTFLAGQVSVAPENWQAYRWNSRAAKYHRAQIRALFGFRQATAQDGIDLTAWLLEEAVPQEQRPERLRERILRHCKAIKLEPPADGRIQRFIDSALQRHEQALFARTFARLGPRACAAMDALLDEPTADDAAPGAAARESMSGLVSKSTSGPKPRPAAAATWMPQTLQDLRTDPGRVGVKTFLREVAKLRRIREIGLPADLFAEVAPNTMHIYRQRASAEKPSALLAHPAERRATLLAALLVEREQEIIDNLVELLIRLMQRIVARAEDKVEAAYVTELKRVANKGTILFQIADAAVTHPDGTVRDVIFPVVSEATLRDLVAEYKAHAPAYREHVHTIMRASYRTHYRRMLPQLLEALEFRLNNDAHRPVVQALHLLTDYATSSIVSYPPEESVPIEGVVPAKWWEMVVERDADGSPRVNRVSYELSVLQALRDRVRTKEIWVVGARKFRNPEQDLPPDFEAKRATYYEALNQPSDAQEFVARLRTQLQAALTALDTTLPTNPTVTILTKKHGWIRVSPLKPQPPPPQPGAVQS